MDDGIFEARWYDDDGNFIGDGYPSFSSAGFEDDPARVYLGGDWYTPSYLEWKYLKTNTELFTWERTAPEYDDETGDLISLGGYTVTSHAEGCEGNSIFLPAAGWVDEYGVNVDDDYGYYWSSTGYPRYSGYPIMLSLTPYQYYLDYVNPYYGLSIRGVRRDLKVTSFSNFQSAGFRYEPDCGYEILFMDSEWPEEFNPEVEPEGDYFIIQIPEELFDTEVDLSGYLYGYYWSLYAGWRGAGQPEYNPDDFVRGTPKTSYDPESKTITIEMDAITIDSHEIKLSYSGSYVYFDEYMWNWT